jgi:hypothetical protein
MDTAAATLRLPSLLSSRTRRLTAAVLLTAAVSVPLTGTGSALGAEHAPAHVTTAAVADAASTLFAVAKRDV